MTIAFSDFARKHNSRSSGNSYTSLTEQQVECLVLDNWHKAIPGQGETTLDRKVLVPVDPRGFWCPPRASLVEGMNIKAEVKTRQAGEDPSIEIYVEEAEARRCNALVFQEAKRVDVVCYSADALLENNGSRSSDCDWEIVCFLAINRDVVEPMQPLAMARNFLEKVGGTKGDYSAKEFAEAIWHHHTQKGVKVKLEK